MAIRLTESRLRQIIREEARLLTRNRRNLREAASPHDELAMEAITEFGLDPDGIYRAILITYPDQLSPAVAYLKSKGLKARKLPAAQYEDLYGEDDGSSVGIIITGPALQLASAYTDASNQFGGERIDAFTAVEAFEPVE